MSVLIWLISVYGGEVLTITGKSTSLWVYDNEIKVQAHTYVYYENDLSFWDDPVTVIAGSQPIELYDDETGTNLHTFPSDTTEGRFTFRMNSLNVNWQRLYIAYLSSCGSNTAMTEHLAACLFCGKDQFHENTGASDILLCDDNGCTEEITKAIGQEPCNHSPIVLDLARDGFDFSGPEGAVPFDLYGDGKTLLLQWVLPMTDDAFLAHDLNGNGLVDDGSELFGSGTWLELESRLAPNGFIGLAQHDSPALGGNGDGMITRDDEVWSRLLLWNDLDADGVSEDSELIDLAEAGLVGLETIPRERRRRDRHGNLLRFFAKAHEDDRRPIEMVDVFFLEVSDAH